jgi:protein DGCR14
MLVTPSPAPGEGESPLMTWGRLDATPLRLDPFAADDPPLDVAAAGGRAFHIAPPGKRGASLCCCSVLGFLFLAQR